MALSNAERQRRYRQRLKEQALRNDREPNALREAVYEHCRQWWAEHGHDKSGSNLEDDIYPQSADEEAERELSDLNDLIERWLSDSGYTLCGEPDDEASQAVISAARNLVT